MKLIPQRSVPERGIGPVCPLQNVPCCIWSRWGGMVPGLSAGCGKVFRDRVQVVVEQEVGAAGGTVVRESPPGPQVLLHLVLSVTAGFISSLPGQVPSFPDRSAGGPPSASGMLRAAGWAPEAVMRKASLGPLPGMLQRSFSIHPAVKPRKSDDAIAEVTAKQVENESQCLDDRSF